MKIHLVVNQPFWEFTKGEVIADTEMIDSIISGPNSANVVKVAAPDAPPLVVADAIKPKPSKK